MIMIIFLKNKDLVGFIKKFVNWEATRRALQEEGWRRELLTKEKKRLFGGQDIFSLKEK